MPVVETVIVDGGKLRRHRLKAQLWPWQLAELAGVSKQLIYAIEAGDKPLSTIRFAWICDALDIADRDDLVIYRPVTGAAA